MAIVELLQAGLLKASPRTLYPIPSFLEICISTVRHLTKETDIRITWKLQHGNLSKVQQGMYPVKVYLRDFRCRTAREVHEHATGRRCDDPTCRGALHDTIINFGEGLPPKPLHLAEKNSKVADLMLVLGSSLTVTPAADMPASVGETGRRLIICNLQKTPLDCLASYRVFAKCDDLMKQVMAELGMEIPRFKLRRRIIVNGGAGEEWFVRVSGADSSNRPFDLIKKADFTFGAPPKHISRDLSPFSVHGKNISGTMSMDFKIRLHFMGHYQEDPISVDFTLNLKGKGDVQVFELTWDPFLHSWEVALKEFSAISEMEELFKSLKL